MPLVICAPVALKRSITRPAAASIWAERVPAIVSSACVSSKGALVDGECVICDEKGFADFKTLRGALASGKAANAFLYAFDLLELNGEDLRKLPWEERRIRLARILKRERPGILLSEHTEGDGAALFRHACEMGLKDWSRNGGCLGTAPDPAATG